MKFPWANDAIAANGACVRENFAQWFGTSKATDKAGTPLRLYHGTTATFDEFDPESSNRNTKTYVPNSCFFFTSSQEVACSYAGQKTPVLDSRLPTEELYNHWLGLLKRHGPVGLAMDFHNQHSVPCEKEYKTGANVLAVYLRIKKPLKVNAKGESWNNIRFGNDDWSINDLVDHARQKGYDGLCVRNVHDRQEGKGPVSDVYAVFSPNHIKSALGNSGLYLPDSASMDDQEAAEKLRLATLVKSMINSNLSCVLKKVCHQ